MNRIYQGKVTAVEILDGKDDSGNTKWKKLDAGESALWQHHELFQDAVNYYTLALAAMGAGLEVNSPKGKAVLGWREQVKDSWLNARRRAVRFSGPHVRLAGLLGVNPAETDAGKAFEISAAALLENSPAKADALNKALLQMLEEVDQSDLNQFCVSRLPWLCTPHGQLDATPKNVAQQQEARMLTTIREIHGAAAHELEAIAEKVDLGCFVTQTPKERIEGGEARMEAERLFKSATAKAKGLASISGEFAGQLDRLGGKLVLPRLGRKPKGAYPLAVVFKLFPTTETWEAFKSATGSLRKKAEKTTESPLEIGADFIAEARTAADQPIFDYFSNRAFYREVDNHDRAVWFDFDLAAFIEAVKAPHRYFQDSLSREAEAKKLRAKKLAMEGRGGEADDENEEDEAGQGAFGFEGDKRIGLLREIVTGTLGYIAEAENSGTEGERIEYTIQERTLRGFEEIKEKWSKLSERGEATEEKLLAAVAEQQTKQRDDFGSATLYRELAKAKFHPVWREAGTETWHALDPLKAWLAYKELCHELQDKERVIRFTPAHPEHSPRYFIIPKQGRYGCDHEAGQLAFSCGVVLKTARGWEPSEVRIAYTAPRLLRDELRHGGNEELDSAPWLQPMMKALRLPETDPQDFANCRVTLQPQKLEPRDNGQPKQGDTAEDCYNIQLTFPVEVNTEKLVASVGKGDRWKGQFNMSPDGDKFNDASLRWPHEKQRAKPPLPWYEQARSFRCIAVDLGQRDAGAFARLMASNEGEIPGKLTRYIGEAGGKKWRAKLERSGLFRLPGEDAQVWREISDVDKRNPEDSGKPFDFRQELWGERGRPARDWESDDTADLMRLLEAFERDADGEEKCALLPDGWRDKGTALTFPEQNGKLLIAMRRYQSRIARLHRWCWFVKADDKQKEIAWKEIAECDDLRLVAPDYKLLAAKRDPRVIASLESQLRERLQRTPGILLRIANRVLPLRGRSWHWEKHPNGTDRNTLHRLTQAGASLDSKARRVWLRGQRGLSIERIEQVEELRKRFQSLNQTLRREIGGKPPIRRDESVPDPCPDLLEKLDNLKEQRVNQTAHMILAEALGLRLAPPPANKKALLQQRDQHGVYEKIIDKSGKWIGPVDFIVIEDLSRYRASQGRAPRENSRLMKWCHRSVRDKLVQLCEVFGLPVVQTPAAWSSRFCSRSGAAGFRAVEVTKGFENDPPWIWLKEKKDGESLTAEARVVRELIRQVEEANRGRDGEKKKYRTLLAPSTGGPIFVAAKDSVPGADMQPALVQADINAAINLALRAIASPLVWSIFPRLRTQRDKKDGSLAAREKRKFGEKNPPKLVITKPEKINGNGSRMPNFFADLAGCVDGNEWGEAKLPDDTRLVSGKALWVTIKQLQWERVQKINDRRLQAWKNKEDDLPM